VADSGDRSSSPGGRQAGAVGRTVTSLLLDRGPRVPRDGPQGRRSGGGLAGSGRRRAGADVVAEDLLEPADVYRVVNGCRRVYFAMSVSAGSLEANVNMAAVARELRVDALVELDRAVSMIGSRTGWNGSPVGAP